MIRESQFCLNETLGKIKEEILCLISLAFFVKCQLKQKFSILQFLHLWKVK